jgi:hypothetical protein
MRRLTTAAAGVLAALAAVFIAASAAMAAAPEYGRCAATSGGGYKDKLCTKSTASKGKFEWEVGPGPRPGFSWEARSLYSPRYHECSKAISEEGIAANYRARAEGAGEPEKGELEREAERHEVASQQAYAEAGNPNPPDNRAQCEKLIEDESARAPAVFETVPKGPAKHLVPALKLACGGVSANGQYSGPSTVGDLVVTFTECASKGTACSSEAAGEGEIVSSTLGGTLGVTRLEHGKSKPGLALAAFEEGAPLVAFSCGSTTAVITGSVITEVAGDHPNLVEDVAFNQSAGVQRPQSFLGGPVDVLESSIDGGAEEQTGLALKVQQKNEEAIEVNTIV